MKPTEFIVENSIIAQEADDMHRDHEVQMARSQLYSAAQAAIQIHKLLKNVSEMEGLEGWVQTKIAVASEYLESVQDYLKYEAVSQEPEMMAFAEDAANYAVEKIISEKDFAGWKDTVEKNPERFNEPTRDFYSRNTPRFGGDQGQPGARSSIQSGEKTVDRQGNPVTGLSTRIEKPEGVPKVSKLPITGFGMPGPHDEADPRLGADLDPKMMMKRSMKEQTAGYTQSNDTGTTTYNAAGKATQHTTPSVGGFSQTKDLQTGRTTTTGQVGGVGVTRSTGGGVTDVTSGTVDLGPQTATVHSGVGFGGAGKDVQAPISGSITDKATGKTTNIVGRLPTQQDLGKDLSERKNTRLKEMATGGASSAGAVATSMTGPANKKTSGVPKKVGNAYKPKKVEVGKGVY